MARNKRLMLKWIIILAAMALLAALGALAYRHFVTDRIMDKDGMENPNYVQQLDGLKRRHGGAGGRPFAPPGAAMRATLWQIDGETLTLSENGGELCAKEYCAIADGIYRIYAMDGGSFGELDHFDYAPGVLTELHWQRHGQPGVMAGALSPPIKSNQSKKPAFWGFFYVPVLN